MPLYIILALFLLFSTTFCKAQISLDFPVERAVFQRDNDNFGFVAINGSSSQEMDSLVAELQSISKTNVIIKKKLNNTSALGYFQERVKLEGGWYKLTMNAYKAGKLQSQSIVQKVGVGEVFIICGQSNAQGIRGFGARGANDDRVNAVNYYNENLSFTPPDKLEISKINPNSDIAPYGKSPWCWGELGDMIAAKYDVPVLFFNAAWQATFSSNWSDSRDDIPAFDILTFGTLPVGYPYHHLDMSHKYYASLFGVRAVLWHLGETDTNPGIPRPGEYSKYIKYTIEKSREDFGFNVPWMISEVSYSVGVTSEIVLQDQRDLINDPNLNTFQGPFTDPVMQPRFDGTHFGNNATQNGLTELAKAWFEKIDSDFLQLSKPILSNPLAEMSITCSSQGLTIAPKNNQSIYKWDDNGTQSNRTINTGTRGVVILDNLKNYKIGNKVDASGIKFNASASIISSSNEFCEGDSLLVKASESFFKLKWNNGSEADQFYVTETADLWFEAFNPYGCKVTTSNSKSIKKIITPDYAINPTFEINNGYFDSSDNTIETCASNTVQIEALGDWNSIKWNGMEGSKVVEISTDSVIQFAGMFDPMCALVESEPFYISLLEHPNTPSIEQNSPYSIGVKAWKSYDDRVQFTWLRGTATLDDSGITYQPTEPGIYRNRAILRISPEIGCESGLSNEIDFSIDPNQEIVIIYPNPTYDEVKFAASKPQKSLKVTVLNTNGMHLHEQESADWDGVPFSISLSSLPPGLYFINIDTAERHLTKKIQKK